MAADEEHGVIETRLDVGNLGLDEAETAEEVVLRDKVGQGNALREEADIGPCGIERGVDEPASAHAEFWNALAGLRCEVVHRRQDVPQLSEGCAGEFEAFRRERGARVGVAEVCVGGIHRGGGRVV